MLLLVHGNNFGIFLTWPSSVEPRSSNSMIGGEGQRSLNKVLNTPKAEVLQASNTYSKGLGLTLEMEPVVGPLCLFFHSIERSN